MVGTPILPVLQMGKSGSGAVSVPEAHSFYIEELGFEPRADSPL